MPTGTGLALLAGAASAFAFSALAVGAPLGALFGYFSQTPLLLVALASGPASAGLSGAIGVALTALAGGVGPAVVFAFVIGAPAILLAAAASGRAGAGRSDRPAAEPASISGRDAGRGFAAVGLFASALLIWSILEAESAPGGYAGLVEETASRAAAAIGAELDAPVVELAKRGLPALVAASWLIMIAVNARLAVAIARRRETLAKPVADLRDFALPSWASFPPMIALAFAAIGEGWLLAAALAALAATATPYFLAGLAILHSVIAARGGGGAWIAALYGGLFLFFFYLAPLIAGLGFADEWLDLRRRIAKNGA